jgi:hypothetical protein
MFMSCVIWAWLVHDDVFVRWHRQPDVNLKPDAVAMLVAGCDHLDAATCNSVVMGFQPLDLAQYLGSSSVRWFWTFEGDLWRDLHFDLSSGLSGILWQSMPRWMVASDGSGGAGPVQRIPAWQSWKGPVNSTEPLLNVRKPVSARLRQLYGGDGPLAIVAPDWNSQAVQFIKPNRFDGPGLSIAKDHGVADKFGLNLLELAEDRGRADHHSWHRVTPDWDVKRRRYLHLNDAEVVATARRIGVPAEPREMAQTGW